MRLFLSVLLILPVALAQDPTPILSASLGVRFTIHSWSADTKVVETSCITTASSLAANAPRQTETWLKIADKMIDVDIPYALRAFNNLPQKLYQYAAVYENVDTGKRIATFRPTEGNDGWLSNFLSFPVDNEMACGNNHCGKVHEYWQKQAKKLVADSALYDALTLDNNGNALQDGDIVAHAHSKGGAMAMLVAMKMYSERGVRMHVTAYGSPKPCANTQCSDWWKNSGIGLTKFQLDCNTGLDPTPETPPGYVTPYASEHLVETRTVDSIPTCHRWYEKWWRYEPNWGSTQWEGNYRCTSNGYNSAFSAAVPIEGEPGSLTCHGRLVNAYECKAYATQYSIPYQSANYPNDITGCFKEFPDSTNTVYYNTRQEVNTLATNTYNDKRLCIPEALDVNKISLALESEEECPNGLSLGKRHCEEFAGLDSKNFVTNTAYINDKRGCFYEGGNNIYYHERAKTEPGATNTYNDRLVCYNLDEKYTISPTAQPCKGPALTEAECHVFADEHLLSYRTGVWETERAGCYVERLSDMAYVYFNAVDVTSPHATNLDNSRGICKSITCPLGYEFDAKQNYEYCVPCKMGGYRDASTETCQECPAGTTSLEGASSCKLVDNFSQDELVEFYVERFPPCALECANDGRIMATDGTCQECPTGQVPRDNTCQFCDSKLEGSKDRWCYTWAQDYDDSLSTTGKTQQECVDLCANTDGCIAYSHSSAGVCELSRNPCTHWTHEPIPWFDDWVFGRVGCPYENTATISFEHDAVSTIDNYLLTCPPGAELSAKECEAYAGSNWGYANTNMPDKGTCFREGSSFYHNTIVRDNSDTLLQNGTHQLNDYSVCKKRASCKDGFQTDSNGHCRKGCSVGQVKRNGACVFCDNKMYDNGDKWCATWAQDYNSALTTSGKTQEECVRLCRDTHGCVEYAYSVAGACQLSQSPCTTWTNEPIGWFNDWIFGSISCPYENAQTTQEIHDVVSSTNNFLSVCPPGADLTAQECEAYANSDPNGNWGSAILSGSDKATCFREGSSYFHNTIVRDNADALPQAGAQQQNDYAVCAVRHACQDGYKADPAGVCRVE